MNLILRYFQNYFIKYSNNEFPFGLTETKGQLV